MGAGLELSGFEAIGWVGERCCLLFLVYGFSALCGRCTLCRLLWWWPSCSVNVCWGGRRRSQWSRGGGSVGVNVGVCGSPI